MHIHSDDTGRDRGTPAMLQLKRDTISDDDFTVFDYGWDDRIDGKHPQDNPYAINNAKHYDWENGWVAADQATEQDLDKSLAPDQKTHH